MYLRVGQDMYSGCETGDIGLGGLKILERGFGRQNPIFHGIIWELMSQLRELTVTKSVSAPEL
jgi:hypothetical protein